MKAQDIPSDNNSSYFWILHINIAFLLPLSYKLYSD